MRTSSWAVTKYLFALQPPNLQQHFRSGLNIGNGALKSMVNILKKKFCKEQYMYEGYLKSMFPYFFLRILWTDQCEIAGRYNFGVSSNTVKKCVAIASQKCTEHIIENGAAIARSRALEGGCSSSFFYHSEQISRWNSWGNVFVPVPYHLYRHIVTIHWTHFPMNFNAWFVLDGKKRMMSSRSLRWTMRSDYATTLTARHYNYSKPQARDSFRRYSLYLYDVSILIPN